MEQPPADELKSVDGDANVIVPAGESPAEPSARRPDKRHVGIAVAVVIGAVLIYIIVSRWWSYLPFVLPSVIALGHIFLKDWNSYTPSWKRWPIVGIVLVAGIGGIVYQSHQLEEKAAAEARRVASATKYQESIDALRQELKALRTVSPLRKQAADLSKEVLAFHADRERFTDRFKPGQTLTDKEGDNALKWYAETVRLFHLNYLKRLISVLNEIHTVTGMEVEALQSDAMRVKYAPQIQDVATRLSAIAASLP